MSEINPFDISWLAKNFEFMEMDMKIKNDDLDEFCIIFASKFLAKIFCEILEQHDCVVIHNENDNSVSLALCTKKDLINAANEHLKCEKKFCFGELKEDIFNVAWFAKQFGFALKDVRKTINNPNFFDLEFLERETALNVFNILKEHDCNPNLFDDSNSVSLTPLSKPVVKAAKKHNSCLPNMPHNSCPLYDVKKVVEQTRYIMF